MAESLMGLSIEAQLERLETNTTAYVTVFNTRVQQHQTMPIGAVRNHLRGEGAKAYLLLHSLNALKPTPKDSGVTSATIQPKTNSNNGDTTPPVNNAPVESTVSPKSK